MLIISSSSPTVDLALGETLDDLSRNWGQLTSSGSGTSVVAVPGIGNVIRFDDDNFEYNASTSRALAVSERCTICAHVYIEDFDDTVPVGSAGVGTRITDPNPPQNYCVWGLDVRCHPTGYVECYAFGWDARGGYTEVSSSYLPLNQWVLITAWSGSEQGTPPRIYFDTTDVSISANGGGSGIIPPPLQMIGFGGQFVTGMIDVIRIWRRLLSPIEIARLAANPRNGMPGL